jgi:RNA polymerase sigma factor (sigma-70 family)
MCFGEPCEGLPRNPGEAESLLESHPNARKLDEARRRRERGSLIVEHMPIVRRIAASLRHLFPTISFPDLVSCGNVGLCDAAGRYDPSRGTFAAYAYARIRGAIIDAHKRKAFREEQHDSLDAPRGDDNASGGSGYEHGTPANQQRTHHLAINQSPLPDALTVERERLNRTKAALDFLPEDERAVMAGLLAGAKPADIAAAHGRSLSWVRVRLARGRKALSSRLSST